MGVPPDAVNLISVLLLSETVIVLAIRRVRAKARNVSTTKAK